MTGVPVPQDRGGIVRGEDRGVELGLNGARTFPAVRARMSDFGG
jgi:hypothetical protein